MNALPAGIQFVGTVAIVQAIVGSAIGIAVIVAIVIVGRKLYKKYIKEE